MGRLLPLLQVGDPVQGTGGGEPGEMSGYRAPCSSAVRVLARQPLPRLPQMPALRGTAQTCLAEGMDVAEIPWRPALHERAHLGGNQVVEAVEPKSARPHAVDGCVDLSRTVGDLETENCCPRLFELDADNIAPCAGSDDAEWLKRLRQLRNDQLPVLAADRLSPPRIEVMSRAILMIVRKPEGAADGQIAPQPFNGKSIDARKRERGNFLRDSGCNHSVSVATRLAAVQPVRGSGVPRPIHAMRRAVQAPNSGFHGVPDGDSQPEVLPLSGPPAFSPDGPDITIKTDMAQQFLLAGPAGNSPSNRRLEMRAEPPLPAYHGPPHGLSGRESRRFGDRDRRPAAQRRWAVALHPGAGRAHGLVVRQ